MKSKLLTINSIIDVLYNEVVFINLVTIYHIPVLLLNKVKLNILTILTLIQQQHVLTTLGVWECGEGGGGGPAYERERDQLGPGNQDRCAPDPKGTASSLMVSNFRRPTNLGKLDTVYEIPTL